MRRTGVYLASFLWLLSQNLAKGHRLLQATNATHQRWTVECTGEPLLFCNDNCTAEALIQEQQDVFLSIQELYPQAALLASLYKIVNHIYIVLPLHAEESTLLQIRHVKTIYPAQAYQLQQLTDTLDYLQVIPARSSYCVTGRGVKVAILDTGVDYTHRQVGGPGTLEAYRLAYGSTPGSINNKRRDGLFPTSRVIAGYDFLGDTFTANSNPSAAAPDDDPIDGPGIGHGTAVAHAILSMAPEVQLVAVKICNTAVGGQDSICPDFAVTQGLEYIFDIFQDGTNVGVDIINLSIGKAYGSAFFDSTAKALSNVAAKGVLAVLAQGNAGSSPYIASPLAGTPNVMAIGATESAESGREGVMSDYSSRGPGVNHAIKPDISAPGGPYNLARSSTGTGFQSTRGTSYSCPLVAGAAALIKEKCPRCSPFGLRAILMNNAKRSIVVRSRRTTTLAPISKVGSGELDIEKALGADFWAYNIDDIQPSVGLGLINVDNDMTVSKNIRIQSLAPGLRILSMSADFRDPDDEASGALGIRFSSDRATFSTCGQTHTVTVHFDINANLVPLNAMTTGGAAGNSDSNLDRNEFDGWIVLSSGEKDISLPFHMILRRAADVTMQNTVLPALSGDTTEVKVGMVNRGVGPAQIDSFELLYLGSDEPELGEGSNALPLDIRYVGYRVVPVDVSTCSSGHLVEFAISTWEAFRTPHYKLFEVQVDSDGDLFANKRLYSMGFLLQSENVECRVWDGDTSAWSCTGFPVDHVPESGNIVLRACAEALGLTREGSYRMAVHTESFPGVVSDSTTGPLWFQYPQPALSAGNFDLDSGAYLESISVSGDGVSGNGFRSRGLLFFTNAYRSPSSTGAATRSSESLVLVFNDVHVPREVTADGDWAFDPINDVRGPDCSWSNYACMSRSPPNRRRRLGHSAFSNTTLRSLQGYNGIPDVAGAFDLGTCFETNVPRGFVTWVNAVPTPVPSPGLRTLAPTILPTRPSDESSLPFMDGSSSRASTCCHGGGYGGMFWMGVVLWMSLWMGLVGW